MLQGIANTVWAFATLEVLHTKFLDGLAERAQHPALLKTFKYSSGLAKTVWGFAVLKRTGNESLMFALAGMAFCLVLVHVHVICLSLSLSLSLDKAKAISGCSVEVQLGNKPPTRSKWTQWDQIHANTNTTVWGLCMSHLS